MEAYGMTRAELKAAEADPEYGSAEFKKAQKLEMDLDREDDAYMADRAGRTDPDDADRTALDRAQDAFHAQRDLLSDDEKLILQWKFEALLVSRRSAPLE